MSLLGLHVRTLGPQMVALFGKAVELLGGSSLGVNIEIYSLAPLTPYYPSAS